MKKQLTKLALTATLALATTFTLNACEEKKKQDGTTATEPAAATTFTDPRDNKTYKTVKIGTQVWMAENLNYNADYGECYDGEESNCEKYGRLYYMETAMKVCPSGWHLPLKEEWEVLIAAVGGKETAGKYLKATSGWNDYEGKSGNGEDKFGFSAMPGGRSECCEGGGYFSVGYVGYWLSANDVYSDKATDYIAAISGDSVESYNYSTGDAYSVRCLQDDANYVAKIAAAKAKTESIKAKAKKGSFTDSRDGKTYKTVKLDNQTWMAENLNYDASGSACYENQESNCQKYGRLYNWETAKSVCPSGWHLPSYEEWGVLTVSVGGYETAGKRLKTVSGWNVSEWGNKPGNGTDEFGFSALPGGGGRYSGFVWVGTNGNWWTPDEYNSAYGSYGCNRSMYNDGESISGSCGNGKDDLYSVRCLQN